MHAMVNMASNHACVAYTRFKFGIESICSCIAYRPLVVCSELNQNLSNEDTVWLENTGHFFGK